MKKKKIFKIAALPIDMKERISKKGNKYAYAQFSDNTGNFEAIIFSDILNESSELIKKQDLLLLTLEIMKNDNNINSRIREMITLRQFINESNKKVKIITNKKTNILKLKDHLNKYKTDTGSEVKLSVFVDKKLVNISVPGKYDFFNIVNNQLEDMKILN